MSKTNLQISFSKKYQTNKKKKWFSIDIRIYLLNFIWIDKIKKMYVYIRTYSHLIRILYLFYFVCILHLQYHSMRIKYSYVLVQKKIYRINNIHISMCHVTNKIKKIKCLIIIIIELYYNSSDALFRPLQFTTYFHK